MPFIQTGQTHGDTFPAEEHAAFNFGLAAHVEGSGSGIVPAESSNDLGIYTGTDKNFRTAFAIPDGEKLTNHILTGHTVTGSTAGQNGIDAHSSGIPIGFQGIYGDVNASVQRQSAAVGGCDQRRHGFSI